MSGFEVGIGPRVLIHLDLIIAGNEDGAEPAEARKEKKERKGRNASLVNPKQNQQRRWSTSASIPSLGLRSVGNSIGPPPT